MSLPASNRKAPSRAAIAATLSALTVFGASSALAVDTAAPGTQQGYGYGQPAFGFGFQGQMPPASFGYGQQQVPAGYGAPSGYAVQPASTLNAPAAQGFAAPQGFAQPAPQGFAQQPVPQGFGAPQPFPGYGVPGGYAAPVGGFDPYAAMQGFGAQSSQWGQFAPSEPNYAPAERNAAQAAAPAASAPAAAPVMESATTATVAPDYSYEVVPAAPASTATYVGNSQQITSGGNDPYQAVPAQQQGSYAVAQPSYTQQYDAVAPAPQAAPVPQETVNLGGYEYQPVPQQPAADYYDLSAQTAAAAAAAVAAPAPAYEVSSYAPQQVAPVAGHFVQVGAFLDANRANNLVNKLGAAGEQAFIVSAQVRGKLYHRVRVVAASKRDARVARDRIRNLGYYEARMVKG